MSRASDPNVSAARAVVGAEVLVIDKDPSVRAGMEQLFQGSDVNVTAVDDPAAAWELLDQRFFSVVVVDLDTPQPGGGVETAQAVAVASPISAIVVLTPRRAFDDAVSAIRAGAVDVIVKAPESVGYLADRIRQAASRSLERRQLRATLGEVREFHELFLRSFMDAERRAHELDARLAGRSTRSPLGAELTVLVVGSDGALVEGLRGTKGFRFLHAHSGGEALDRAGSETIHLALVSDRATDLPPSMVMRSLKSAHPDALVVQVAGPRPGGTVEIVEGERRIPVIREFTAVEQLAGQLDELAEATRARDRERKFLQAFREKHYELLRRLATLKARLESA